MKQKNAIQKGLLCALGPLAGLAFAGLGAFAAQGQDGKPLAVCATTPDLADLALVLGGDRADVFCFSSGPEDPHVIDIRPSYVKRLDAADLFLQVGLGIENAWLGSLMNRVKNPEVRPGRSGHLNLGLGVRPLEGEEGAAIPDSFHEEGNPHYLLDPVEGLKAAKTICDRMVELRPQWTSEFEDRHARFVRKWADAYFGAAVAGDVDLEGLEDFESTDQLEGHIAEATAQAGDRLGGVAGLLRPLAGRTIVGDHDLWPYFARRFELNVLGYLEPSPGIPPTTKHLREVIERMRSEKAGVILTAPYFPIRHVQFVARRADARIAQMAHQTGGRKGAESYIAMIQHNARMVADALTPESQ